jgi:hypothetical protein
MNGICTFDIARTLGARKLSCSGFHMAVTVVVWSTAGLTEPGMRSGTGTGFGGDTRFDMDLLELLLW